MVQLLAALLEWLAIAAFSLMGVSYEAPEPCPVPDAQIVYTADLIRYDVTIDPSLRLPDAPGLNKRSSRDDCATEQNASQHLQPIKLQGADVYDS